MSGVAEKKPDKGKEKILLLRVTANEKDAIRRSAKAASLTMSEWVRRRLFGG